MKTKIEIKTLGGRVLFSYKTENNTIKKTMEEAITSQRIQRVSSETKVIAKIGEFNV